MSSAGHQKARAVANGDERVGVMFGRGVASVLGFLEPYTNRLQKKVRFLSDKKILFFCLLLSDKV